MGGNKMSTDNHWARDVPNSEFTPLGQHKLELLVLYIQRNNWTNGSRNITAAEMCAQAREDRQFASRLYVIFKKDIEHMAMDNWQIEITDQFRADATAKRRVEKVASKQKRSKAKTKKKSLPDNVISFEDFKRKKVS